MRTQPNNVCIFAQRTHFVTVKSKRKPKIKLQESCCQSIASLRTPDARFAQSKEASVRFRFYVPALRCRHVATSRHTANRHEVICAVIQIFYRVGTSLRLVGTNVCGFHCRKFTLFVSVRWFVAFSRYTCKSDRQ